MTEIAGSVEESNWSSGRIVGTILAIILLSFAFGIAMFLPAEHRDDKLSEMLNRYQARNPDADQTQPVAKKRVLLPSALNRLPVLESVGGDFALESSRGGMARLADFRGNLVLLNFGYTNCPDVCPTTLRRMRDVLGAFPHRAGNIDALFVTLDPIHDDAARLSDYLRFFGDEFIGLTGSVVQIAEVARLYKVHFETEASGTIAHSNQIYLIDGEGRTRSTFSSNVTVSEMIETVDRLL